MTTQLANSTVRKKVNKPTQISNESTGKTTGVVIGDFLRRTISQLNWSITDHRMDSIRNLISECGESNSTTEDKEVIEEAASANDEGTLLITACHDFDNATSKGALGLDEPNIIRLPHSIRQSFSSSSSHHAFFLSVEGRIYAVGRNDHGQLGRNENALMTTFEIVTNPI